jgi:hypothetical protein
MPLQHAFVVEPLEVERARRCAQGGIRRQTGRPERPGHAARDGGLEDAPCGEQADELAGADPSAS